MKQRGRSVIQAHRLANAIGDAIVQSNLQMKIKRDGAAPGRYGEDFRPFFAALHQAGYDRRISIECNWQNLAAEVSPAIETLKEQWMASVG